MRVRYTSAMWDAEPFTSHVGREWSPETCNVSVVGEVEKFGNIQNLAVVLCVWGCSGVVHDQRESGERNFLYAK